MLPAAKSSERGQVLVLFALSLSALVLAAAVVVDGGYAFAQRRETQNAADFAAMAGTRIVGMAKVGEAEGTAANVKAAIAETLAANDAQLAGAQYVDAKGVALGDVASTSLIPTNAFGVVVDARSDWRPFLLGVIGVTDWAASARATAMTKATASVQRDAGGRGCREVPGRQQLPSGFTEGLHFTYTRHSYPARPVWLA